MPDKDKKEQSAIVRRMTRTVSKQFGDDDEGLQNWHKYQQLMEQPGWEVHDKMIVDIANKMVGYLLTAEYTNLDSTEKDVQQRAIFMTKEILEVIRNPMGEYDRLQRFKQETPKPQEVTQLRNNLTGGPFK